VACAAITAKHRGAIAYTPAGLPPVQGVAATVVPNTPSPQLNPEGSAADCTIGCGEQDPDKCSPQLVMLLAPLRDDIHRQGVRYEAP